MMDRIIRKSMQKVVPKRGVRINILHPSSLMSRSTEMTKNV